MSAVMRQRIPLLVCLQHASTQVNCPTMQPLCTEKGPLCDVSMRRMDTGMNTYVVLQVIKLSDAVQVLPRQATQFVHGAPGSFLAIGDEKAKVPAGERPRR